MAKNKKSIRSSEFRQQVAALPFRRSMTGEVEILVLTSRGTGRFVIPKGWPIKKLGDPDTAAREAFEEAGVVGKVRHKPIGNYNYWKRQADRFEQISVEVYPLKVTDQREDWPEKGQRSMAWLSTEDAATLVDEPPLAQLIRQFCGAVR